jgi:uncharacterized cupredoxin-like copper-binding protein
MPLVVQAHGENAHEQRPSPALATVDKPFGRTGDPSRANRTVDVEMSDAMRFTPASITVRQNDIVRFRVKNAGKAMHELVLGRDEDLQAHAEMMRKYPGMEHDEPYMAHVKPGKVQELVWQFSQPGDFAYACLIPGHYEAGMRGRVRVTPKEDGRGSRPLSLSADPAPQR